MIPRKLKPCKTCGQPSYIFSHGNCQRCSALAKTSPGPYKHTTLAQTESGKVAKPIKAISDKQAKRLAKYRVARDEHFKEYPVCQYPGCSSTDITLHHGAGKTGDLLWNKKYFKSLCWPHHKHCEENPEHAKELKLSFDRLDK